MLKLTYGFVFGAFMLGIAVGLLFAFTCKDADDEVAKHWCHNELLHDNVGFKAALCALAVMFLVLGYFMLAMFRRPYLHIGVAPGGGNRGRANPYGGDSPFYICLTAFDMEDFETMVSMIRTAQVCCM